MATSSSALSLRHVSLPPSISGSPSASPSPSPFLSFSSHSPSKRRGRSSLMVSAPRAPVPPVDLSDPFVTSINSPDSFDFWPRPRKDPGNITASSSFTPTRPKPMQEVTCTAQVDENKQPLEPPPDIESQLLHARIISLTLPLLYLQGTNPNEPIYMYIDSCGTMRDDNEPVALESEGLAIYDTMMSIQNEVHTVILNRAGGHACLIAAAGTKGKRYMLPHAKAFLHEPVVPAYGEMSTSDLVRRTREALIQKNMLTELLAKHTGNSFEKVKELMKAPCYMNFEKAKEFGIVDQMMVRGKARPWADRKF